MAESGFLEILAATAPPFAVVGVGMALRARRVFEPESERRLATLAIQVLFPCLILEHVVGNPALAAPGLVPQAFGAGLLLVAASFGICLVGARLLGLRQPGEARTFAVSAGIPNYGFLPIPLVAALFPAQREAVMGVLFVHNLGVETAMWTAGVMLLRGRCLTSWREQVNGPLLAIVGGLAANALGLGGSLPGWVRGTLGLLGAPAVPLSLLLIGALLWERLGRSGWFGSPRVAAGACLLRCGLLPMGLFALAAWPALDISLRRVLVVQGAMPAALFTMVLAQRYGGRTETATAVAVSTTALGLVTIPLLLGWGLRWAGL